MRKGKFIKIRLQSNFVKQKKSTTHSIQILGTRGIPASHGGFETFAEALSLYLEEKNWDVTVYCQKDSDSVSIENSQWKGINLVHISTPLKGSLGSVLFDLLAIIQAVKRRTPMLILGYNTACFSILPKLFSIPTAMNMDGIEWKRGKWGRIAKFWFWLNESFGRMFSDLMIADHPEIEKHLRRFGTKKPIVMIPYGSHEITEAMVDEKILTLWNLTKNGYALVIARVEPENSVLEIVQGFSMQKRNFKLVIVGPVEEKNAYHTEVLKAANSEVIFTQAQYDVTVTRTLRFFAKFYCHGHTVGGTNPSLLESMGAGSAILAHDNLFNQWVAGDGAKYFKNAEECGRMMGEMESAGLNTGRDLVYNRFQAQFRWGNILDLYEKSLLS